MLKEKKIHLFETWLASMHII